MAEPIWTPFLTERDKQVFESSGYGARQGFGKRPAIIVIDVNYNFCGDTPEPILESIKRWRNSCGAEAWDAVAAIKSLVAAGRAKGLPILYSTGVRREDDWDAGSWAWKNTRSAERVRPTGVQADGNTIVPDIAPGPNDLVVFKQKPSAFHGTPLLSWLLLLGADSLIMTGTTTSGCVRATVLDAFSNNLRVSLVEEGCFDRSQASHAINLCDMHAKYADVIKLDEALSFVRTLPEGLFPDLPGAKRQTGPKAVAA
ncbi:MAG: isochorismatase family protein [Proteobacteria bacterium]|nr:isochorismatase family protein [Burkholderiales bacterium]